MFKSKKKPEDTKKLIENLTPEQEALLPSYVERFTKIGLSTRPTDRGLAEQAMLDGYAYLIKNQKIKDPGKPIDIMWADSPITGATRAAQEVHGRMDVTKEEIKEQLNNASFGSFEAYWVSMYAFIAEQLPVEKDELIDIVLRGIEQWGLYWTFEDGVILTPKPKAIHMKDDKLHCETGMALEYHNGEGLFAIDGELKSCLMEIAFAVRNKEKAG